MFRGQSLSVTAAVLFAASALVFDAQAQTLPPPSRAAVPPRQEPFPEQQRDGAADQAPLDRRTSPRRRWYGWQILAVDGAAVAILATGAAIASNQNEEVSPLILGASGATFVAGPPIVHLAHGHSGKAGGSLALRALPVLLLPIATPDECDAVDESAGGGGCERHAVKDVAFVLSILGVLLAPWVDAGVLAFEDVPAERRTVSVVPWTDARGHTRGLSVAGTF